MDSVLVTQPVTSLDGVVHVPSPVILVHVSKSSVDTTLSSDSVGSGGEQLGDTSSVETGLSQTEGGSQTSTTSTNDQGIVFVVNDGVLVAEEGRSLLCAKGLVGDDAGGGGAAREGASLLSSEALGELQMQLLANA